MIGPTKAGKTTLLATASEYLWEEFGKVLFFNTAELGGFSARVEQRIRQGLIRVFRLRTRDDEAGSLSFETLQLASKGYVPSRFLNHLEGEVEPGVPMIAPITTVHELFCGGCGSSVRRTRFKSKLQSNTCPACKKPVTQQTGKVVSTTAQTPGFEMIGSFAYDGLTSFSDWYLQDMSHRKNLEGEKAALGGEIESGGMIFRGNNRSQVGMAQTRVHELVANSLSIPNLVVMPFWTAISHESSDDTGRLTVVGPKLAGDAKTYIASSWFGNVVEAEVIETDKHEYVRRLWVSQYYDQNNRRHLCGHRGDPRFMPTHFEDAPYSDSEPPTEICTGFSLNYFLKQLEVSIQKGLETDTFGGKGVPGMGSIPATYGDQTEVEEKASVPAPSPAGRPAVRRPSARPTPSKSAGGGTAATPAATPAAVPAAPAEPEPVAPAEDVPTPQTPAEPDAEPPVETGMTAAEAPGAPEAPGGWARPAGARPAPPKAPQSGPKPPGRAAPRPVAAVKAS